MDPSGPSQPPASASYTTADNPVTSTPAEQQEHAAHQHHHHHQGKTEDRLPPNLSSEPQPNISEATPSSLGYGIRGSDHDTTTAVAGSELDGEQMRAPGEGAVADAVRRKPGAGGAEPDMAGGLERKKREQAAARQAVKEDRRHGVVADGGDLREGVDT